ncbi:MAG: hypothetical protein WC897_05005 [Candidatus Gracilibacteria bacterium]
MSSQLDSAGNDFVRDLVVKGHEVSMDFSKAFASTFDREDVKPIEEDVDEVTRLIQGALTPQQAKYLRGVGACTYNATLQADSRDDELLKALMFYGMDSQSRIATVPELTNKLFPFVRGRVLHPTWFHGIHTTSNSEVAMRGFIDRGEPMHYRLREFLRSLPEGVRTQDRWSWATDIATLQYQDLARTDRDAVVLPEEGHFALNPQSTAASVGMAVGRTYNNTPVIDEFNISQAFENARLGALVDFPMQQAK